jgi:hypothetical protein
MEIKRKQIIHQILFRFWITINQFVPKPYNNKYRKFS